MAAIFPFRLALAAVLVVTSSASAQLAHIKAPNFAVIARPVQTANPLAAARVANEVSQLPPSAVSTTVTATGVTNPQTGPAIGAPAAAQPRLEYVRGNAALDLQATQALAGQSEIKNVIGPQGRVLALPGFIRQFDQTGEQLQLKMIALAGHKLAYDSSLKIFVGTIWLGVNEIIAGRSGQQLVTPVDFKILNAESADPAVVQVTSTGEPGYKQVQLRIAAAVQNPAVNIVSNLDPNPTELPLQLNPALVISSDSPIDGLGLATSTINVTALGLGQPKGVVTFQKIAGNGSLTNRKVPLDVDGTVTTELRSEGLGGAAVSASMPGLVPVRTDVTFQFPYMTILASIVGGIVGGLIRVGTSGLLGSRAFQAVGIAVLVGILVFALYAVGVNVLPISPVVKTGAIWVFVVSAIGAFIGPSVLPGRVSSPTPAPGPSPPPGSDGTPPAGG
jgi:hypothetical protein